MQGTFFLGEGLMMRQTNHRNTRISALVILHNADKWFPSVPLKELAIGEVQRLIVARLDEPGIRPPYVTVWENPVADKKLPGTVFNGPRDARWSYDGEQFLLSFRGEERATGREEDWR